MRDKKYLQYFDDIATLFKYLYLDDSISVIVEYKDALMCLKMSEKGEIVYGSNIKNFEVIRTKDLNLNFWYKVIE